MSKPKQPRKELTSLRLEPQVKYLAEIAARVQRRSLTNFIEWVLEESIKNMKLRDDPNDNRTIGDLSFLLWDTSESERLISLALIAPELLTHDEQLIFKVIINERYNFLTDTSFSIVKDSSGSYAVSYPNNNFPHDLTLEHFNIEEINSNWILIIKASLNDFDAMEQLKEKADIQKENSLSNFDSIDNVPF